MCDAYIVVFQMSSHPIPIKCNWLDMHKRENIICHSGHIML